MNFLKVRAYRTRTGSTITRTVRVPSFGTEWHQKAIGGVIPGNGWNGDSTICTGLEGITYRRDCDAFEAWLRSPAYDGDTYGIRCVD